MRSGRRMGSPWFLLLEFIRIARRSRRRTGGAGDKCNADRDAALAASKVKAQIFTHLLYRHWDHYTGDKRSHLFLVSVESGGNARPDSQRSARCSAVFARGRRLRLRYFAGFEGAGVYRESSIRCRRSAPAPDFYARFDRSGGEAGEGEHVEGGNFNPAYSPDGKWIWRGARQARAGYESDKFRLAIYNRATKNIDYSQSDVF